MSEPTQAELVARAPEVFTPNYQPAPLVLDRGEGVHVFDLEGRRYLDMVSGIAVSALGHGHPRLVAAIAEQAAKILHTSNLYYNAPSIRLAERLTAACFADRVFFSNSGAEANEAAIKLARKRAHDRGESERVEVLSFTGSFHGRTLGALSATAQPKYHEGFRPIVPGFVYAPLGDLAAVEALTGPRTAAIIVEPIQGEGGVCVPPAGFLAALRARCDEIGALLIFDEVQTGMGRTGAMFAHQHEGVSPDIMSVAKAIGGGLPLGAMLATAEVAASLSYGSHATTYGGNPVACAAGLVVLDVLEGPGFLDGVRARGEQLIGGLRAISDRTGIFSEVRGRGLLVGAELAADRAFGASNLVAACRERGVLVHVAGPRVLRIAPPLIVDAAAVGEALGVVEDAAKSLG